MAPATAAQLISAGYQQVIVEADEPAVLPASIQKELAQLQQARQLLNSALAEQPDNGALLDLLNFTYQQEIELKAQVNALKIQSI